MKPHFLAVVCPLIAFVALASAPSTHAADPAVLNGSFEDPNIAPNTIQMGGGASWNPSDSNVFLLSNAAGGPQTIFGTQYLGIANPTSSDQQTIPGFVTGQEYVLDLFISNIFNSLSPQLTVMITGAATATGMFNAGPTDGFSEVTLPFSATADGAITLQLIDSGLANIAVDNVSITAVPEPSSVFAMLLASGALTTAAVRRIRNRR